MKITKEVKLKVEEIITEFNNTEFAALKGAYFYFATYRGRFVYLNINQQGTVHPSGRLSYDGDLTDMSFAIYKFSSEKYDDNEFMFPGFNRLDGTVNGALHACNTAYPPTM